jgi:hypothetical protein
MVAIHGRAMGVATDVYSVSIIFTELFLFKCFGGLLGQGKRKNIYRFVQEASDNVMPNCFHVCWQPSLYLFHQYRYQLE